MTVHRPSVRGYPLTSITRPYRGSGVEPSRSVFFKLIRWQVTSFQAIAGSSIIFFFKFIWNMLCLYVVQLKFWFQTDFGCETSASYARKTVAFNHPSAPQENQCLVSHFLTTLGAQEKTDCSSMLWSIMDIHGSIDICQNKVSAGWAPDGIAGSGVDPSRSSTFLKLSADKLPVFKWSQAQVYFFKKSYEIYCVYVTMAPHY